MYFLLRSKIEIVLKSYAVNVFSIIVRSRNVYKIIINKIVALIFVNKIFFKNIKLFFVLKIAIK